MLLALAKPAVVVVLEGREGGREGGSSHRSAALLLLLLLLLLLALNGSRRRSARAVAWSILGRLVGPVERVGVGLGGWVGGGHYLGFFVMMVSFLM